MKFIDKTSVLIIQRKTIEIHGGIHGIRDEGALESAIDTAKNRFLYETKAPAKIAATYAYHLSQAHAFLDGNKRIGVAVAFVFLEINGFQINATEEEIIRLFLNLASSKLSREDVEKSFIKWLKKSEPDKK